MFSPAEMTSILLMNNWMMRAMDAELENKNLKKIIEDLKIENAYLRNLTCCGAD